MPVIIGRTESENRVKVESIAYQIDSHPDGYGISREALPDFPPPKIGVNHFMYFDPQKGRVWFEEQERPLTQEELLAVKLPEIVDKLDTVLEKLAKLEERESA